MRQKTICQGAFQCSCPNFKGERVPSRFVLFSSTLVPSDLRRMGTFVHVASSVDPSEDNASMGNRKLIVVDPLLNRLRGIRGMRDLNSDDQYTDYPRSYLPLS